MLFVCEPPSNCCIGADLCSGELFLGQPFRGLDSGETPKFLEDLDMQMLGGNLKWNNPWIVAALAYVPVASLQYFLGAFERLEAVSNLFSVTFVCTAARLTSLTRWVNGPSTDILTNTAVTRAVEIS